MRAGIFAAAWDTRITSLCRFSSRRLQRHMPLGPQAMDDFFHLALSLFIFLMYCVERLAGNIGYARQ